MARKFPTRARRPPILSNKHCASTSVFRPENLLREARRQKALVAGTVPAVCILDPDGDIVHSLLSEGRSRRDERWACYHTTLYRFELGRVELGIIGSAVGASFAVLVAGELFACGCQLLVSVSSAGQILPVRKPPYFVLIEKALRDEGTSYHYLPPSEFSEADETLIERVDKEMAQLAIPVVRGATWTTDAPFRETEAAIEASKSLGLLAVEMEAAALYAFSRACRKQVICFAHVTNQMGQTEGDFEKGATDGTEDALRVIAIAASRNLGN